jgi:pSer/pThr/pTyr-binding forkhead associated (FHA) protein
LPLLDAKEVSLESFPMIAVAFGENEVARRRLSRPLTVVGRVRPSALPVQSNDLSAAHLVFYWNGSRLWAVDLLSRMGTTTQGAAVDWTELQQGGSLAIGEVTLTFVGVSSVRRERDLGPMSLEQALAASGESGPLGPPEEMLAGRGPGRAATPPFGVPPPAEDDERSVLVERWRAELIERERALQQEQDRWAAIYKQRESEWRQRCAELKEKQAAFAAEQQRQQNALAEERRILRGQMREQAAALARANAEVEQRIKDLESERQQWLAERARREEEFLARAEDLARREAALRPEEAMLPRKETQ